MYSFLTIALKGRYYGDLSSLRLGGPVGAASDKGSLGCLWEGEIT
jgi:hypothetical protein